jgi:hypothetical protein
MVILNDDAYVQKTGDNKYSPVNYWFNVDGSKHHSFKDISAASAE